MKFVVYALVGTLTVIHLALIFIILMGWLFPQLFYLYGFCLVTTALSWIFFNRCILVDVEQWLKRLIGIEMTHKENSFTGTFINSMAGRELISDRLIRILGTVILFLSISWWSYNFVISLT